MASMVLDVVPALIKINGLPAHPLIVHGAVVFGPLAVLGALAYLVPGWRDRLRWPLLAVAVLAFLFIWAAYLTGDNFRESSTFFQDESTPLGKQIEEHEELAGVLRWVTTAFAVVTVVVVGWLHARKDNVLNLAAGAMGVLAVVTLVYVVLTGEAGAKAVFPPDDTSAPVASAH